MIPAQVDLVQGNSVCYCEVGVGKSFGGWHRRQRRDNYHIAVKSILRGVVSVPSRFVLRVVYVSFVATAATVMDGLQTMRHYEQNTKYTLLNLPTYSKVK